MKTTASDIQKKTIYKERKDCDKEEKNGIITETDTRSRIRSSPGQCLNRVADKAMRQITAVSEGKNMPFEIIRNDITKVKADVIVNTANPHAVIGAGTDSAIYHAAGEKELLAERKKIGDIAPGQAAETPALLWESSRMESCGWFCLYSFMTAAD